MRNKYSELPEKTKVFYKLSPELLKLQKEVAQYQRFKVITQELISLNNEICELRPVSEVQDTRELELLKKNSRSNSGRDHKGNRAYNGDVN